MTTKIIWPKCRMMNDKNAFWVGCTDEEVDKKILPLLNEIKENEEIEKISYNKGPSTFKEDQDEIMFTNYFLISADGKDILSYPWSLPYAGQWNASNPFRISAKTNITNLDELKLLEESLDKGGYFKDYDNDYESDDE